jgi:hypothetical protein
LSRHETEDKVEKSLLDKVVRRKTRHKREFAREKAVIMQATKLLSSVKGKISGLILSAEQTQFLELKRRSSISVHVVPISTLEIPIASDYSA